MAVRLMKRDILQDRLKQMGWSRYKLTQEYCRVRGEPTDPSSIKRYEGTIKRALEDPNKSSTEVIELIIKALDGEQLIRWNTREEVLTGQEEVKVS